MGSADLRGTAGVRTRTAARVVGSLGAGVGWAIVGWNLQVATRVLRHIV